MIPLLLVLISCGEASDDGFQLPDTLQQMKLTNAIQGESADKIITQMHQKVVTDQINYIGKYTSSQYNANLYVTVYDNPDDALTDLENMADRIKDPEVGAKLGYRHVRELPDLGRKAYMSLQSNRVHYFFVQNNELYWLDVDPHVAKAALDDLVG
jgi:hypothetical protein